MRERSEKYFLGWEESESSPVTDVGGKGKNLGRLHRYGFSVPLGGVLISQAYPDFLDHNELAGSIQALAAIKADEVLTGEKQLEGVRQKIYERHIPDLILKELAEALAGMNLLEKAVAVRSSAAAEDSASTSFAGIHDSFLNVRGVEHIIKAIKGCYASLWAPRQSVEKLNLNSAHKPKIVQFKDSRKVFPYIYPTISNIIFCSSSQI
ncbi:MAG: hypothetical protein O8C55_03585, partial [Candidatus Methanoperedens sp.]|nr:hypothetical protein [Candidatus Methanoperedens sp.]